ncbi:MAG: ParA family protein [Succinivibrio sp.]|nr:ParA family protein [Succinivibrio sp.]
MTDIIAIANPKGGSAKTATAVNLCCALAATRRKVLLVDLDPHCSATVAVGFEHSASDCSIAGVLLGEYVIDDCIKTYTQGHFDVIPGHEDLTAIPVALYQEKDEKLRLKKALSRIARHYDFIILDCPPALNTLTVNALCAANLLIIPMPCEYFAIDSMFSLIALYQELNASGEASIKLLGIVRTLFDETHPLSQQISHELEEQFEGMLFDSIINYNERISESASSGRPIMLYDKSSSGARAYLALAGEFLKKVRDLKE